MYPLLHLGDGGIWRRSSRREADRFRLLKPLHAQVARVLDVMHARTVAGAGRDQFARVVAAGTADDDDDIALLREFDGGSLALLRWLTNGVAELNFGFWKAR